MFGFGLRVLQLSWHGKGLVQFLCELRGKSTGLRNSFCLKNGVAEVCDLRTVPCGCSSFKFLDKSKSLSKDGLLVSKEVEDSNGDVKAKDVLEEDDDRTECYDKDEQFDERMAAASAAEEAMAMIFYLQSEKSSIEMEANQYRRLGKQK
ncbi:hypothetical protein CJ030_MR2G027555 [Morella rubra]|uniref:GTD-binding domain-containing protein n=1 Tax=Morella rubra TaxID=262757 RepID=A0A6A1WIJ7_9ROSI|nr:hypothetical protein CJ030_MR2G027555 [Morella rubra]